MRRNLKRQAGQGMTEYIIVVALVAVAAIAVYQYFGQVVRAQVAAMAHELSGEDGSASLRAGRQAAQKAAGETRRVTQGLWRQRGGRQVMARHGHASAQRGQALVAGLVLLAGAVAALVAMHRLGRIIEQRVRLTHAVDAAAYSGALLQARHLNAIAYANRSQIAHQVAMAHLVTLAASARYLDSAQAQARRRNPPPSLLGNLFGARAGQAYRDMQGLPGAGAGLADALARHDAVVHGVLADVAAAEARDLIAERDRIMSRVLHASFSGEQADGTHTVEVVDTPLAGLSLRVLDDSAAGFIERIAPGSGSGLADAARAAARRYGFLASRDATRSGATAVLSSCPSLRNELRRGGATWLGPDGRWAAVDTQSFHALRSNRWIGCYFREYAMGWGIALDGASPPPASLRYADAPPADFSQQDFWRWVQAFAGWDLVAGTGNPLANSYGMAQGRQAAGSGLPAYHDIARSRRGLPLSFTVQARLAPNGVPETARPGNPYARTIMASSTAQTYFVRPSPSPDGRDELATLFRPYWQARLAAAGPAEEGQEGRP